MGILSVSQEANLWEQVKSHDGVQASQSLQRLDANRNELKQLTEANVQLLIQHLEAAHIPDHGIQTACFCLLAKWVQSLPLCPDKRSHDAVRQAVSVAVELASQTQKPPELSCALCLFLSCASAVSEGQQHRPACQASICEVLLHCPAALTKSLRLPELLLSLGQAMSQEQDASLVLWIAALMLRLWQAPPEHSQPGLLHFRLNQVAALQPSFSALVSGAVHRQPASSAADLLWQLFGLLQGVPSELEPAAVFAAVGFLEAIVGAAPGHGDSASLSEALFTLTSTACKGVILAQVDKASPEWLPLQAAAISHANALKLLSARPSDDTLRCAAHALASGALSLHELAAAAAASMPPTAADAVLRANLDGVVGRSPARLVQVLTMEYSRCRAELQQELRKVVQQSIEALSLQYSDLVSTSEPLWLQSLDTIALRHALSRAFITSVTLLTSFWEAAEMPGREVQAAMTLHQLALLQFCRLRVSAYAKLVQATLTLAASSPQAALALLKTAPSYSLLVAPVPGVKPSARRWAVDPVLAAELQFRMSLLGPCVPKLTEAALQETALPMVYLFLGHRQNPVTTSANALFCAILQATTEKEQLAPFYASRAVANYPSGMPLEVLMAGMDALGRSLPPGSPATVYCLARVQRRALELLELPSHKEAALGLVHLLAHLLLVVDLQAMADAQDLLADLLRACPHALKSRAIEDVGRIVGGSDDYIRKVDLARWTQQIASHAVTLD